MNTARSHYKERIRWIVRSLKQWLMAFWPETPSGKEAAITAIDANIPCVRCGFCCTYLVVKLTTRDIRVLAHGLGVSKHDAIRRYVRMTPIGPVLRQTGSRCIFLNAGDDGAMASCSVYAFRPEVCRNWVPSLSRHECQEGIRKLANGRGVHLRAETLRRGGQKKPVYYNER
jgi:Fe-S-cluster containining protein